VRYIGKTNTLTLESHIHLAVSGPQAGVIHAEHGVITNEPRVIVLDHPHFDHAVTAMQADQATFYLGPDNSVQRVVATDHVVAQTKPSAADSSAPMHARADHAEFLLTEKQNLLQTGTLTGHVHLEQEGPQPMQGDAGRVILDYAGKNELQMVHALDGARLFQKAAQQTTAKSSNPTSGPQDFELTAPVIDFKVVNGRLIEHAVTSGTAQITTSSPDSPASRTVVTAGKFDGQFSTDGGKNRLTTLHGAPNARIVNSVPGQPDRVSTSDSVVAAFLPEGGIQSITQQDNVVFTDNQPPEKRMQAWARTARYTPADQMLVLTGSPRIANGSMITTANSVRINRATGEALAQGDVKSTYSDVKEQPDGALLASSSPIHVTALSMTAHNMPSTALYSGNARLWQDANIIEAPTIQFDRDRRFVTAQGTAAQPVQTILVQQSKVQREKAQPEKKLAGQSGGGQKSADSGPISITAMKLTYADSERRVHYEDHVFAKGTDFTATASTADAYLRPRTQTSANQSVSGLGQLDHMVAETNVVITEPNRHADGQKLVYTASDDKFVLTGGPPSIFDAEQGKITGVSLTFFRSDDRVLVEGEASTPVVTQTRVAR
jgi:lipopolysaccharide export system protein LptA